MCAEEDNADTGGALLREWDSNPHSPLWDGTETFQAESGRGLGSWLWDGL